jgi:hypothetical protein
MNLRAGGVRGFGCFASWQAETEGRARTQFAFTDDGARHGFGEFLTMESPRPVEDSPPVGCALSRVNLPNSFF